MPATVVAERVGWERSIRTLRDRVAELRPLFVPPDPCQRTEYRPGELAQFDLWQPDVELPLWRDQSDKLWVIVGVSGFSRIIGTAGQSRRPARPRGTPRIRANPRQRQVHAQCTLRGGLDHSLLHVGPGAGGKSRIFDQVNLHPELFPQRGQVWPILVGLRDLDIAEALLEHLPFQVNIIPTIIVWPHAEAVVGNVVAL